MPRPGKGRLDDPLRLVWGKKDLYVDLGAERVQSVMRRKDPDRRLYLAIPKNAAKLFDEPLGQLLLEDHEIRVIVFDPRTEEIIRWIP